MHHLNKFKMLSKSSKKSTRCQNLLNLPRFPNNQLSKLRNRQSYKEILSLLNNHLYLLNHNRFQKLLTQKWQRKQRSHKKRQYQQIRKLSPHHCLTTHLNNRRFKLINNLKLQKLVSLKLLSLC